MTTIQMFFSSIGISVLLKHIHRILGQVLEFKNEDFKHFNIFFELLSAMAIYTIMTVINMKICFKIQMETFLFLNNI